MKDFLHGQADYFLFVGGLASLLLAIVLWGQARRMDMSRAWRWPVGFAALQAACLWLEMAVPALGDSAFFAAARLALFTASFFVLAPFLRQGWVSLQDGASRAICLVLLLFVAVTVAGAVARALMLPDFGFAVQSMGAVVALLGMWFVCEKMVQAGYEKRRRLRYMPALIVLFVALGWFATHWSGRIKERELSEDLLNQAMGIVKSIEPGRAGRISFSREDDTHPTAISLTGQFNAYARAMQYRRIWTVGDRDGKLRLGPQSAPASGETRVPSGTEYRPPSDDVRLALKNGGAITAGPYSVGDRQIVTGFVPLPEPESFRPVLF
ncbi:MAG TPA: hypothetical protein VF719_10300, partial [Abditibacteriaceae bacterium]